MRISQMRDREPFEQTLAQTLARGWSQQHGRPIDVTPGAGSGQRWLLESFFSAYCTRDLGPAGRRFLRDSMRFTPRRSRLLAQMVAADLLARPAALRLAGRPGFTVTPPIPNAADLVVIPGNQRVRTFDFAARTTRVFLKVGFDAVTMRREIAVREGTHRPGLAGPWPRLLAAADDSTWFEEPLLDGDPLPRLAPWKNSRGALSQAARLLADWLAATSRTVHAADHAGDLVTRAATLTATLAQRGIPVPAALTSALPILADLAAGVPALELADAHGDFQGGNVLVAPDGRVWLLDWEHCRPRLHAYDGLTWALGARFGADPLPALAAFVSRGRLPGPRQLAPLLPAAKDRPTRRALAAAFLLEDLVWYLSESTTGPFSVASTGVDRYARALTPAALARLTSA